MESVKLSTDLQSLERKIQLLVGDHKSLKDEIGLLRKENDELKSVLKNKDQQIDDFQNQEKITKIANNLSVGEGDGSGELKKKIDNYIQEIDKCIAHLSKI